MKSKKYFFQSGYTVIELMLVVAIISILASIIMPRMDLAIMRAQQSAAKANLGSIRSTVAIYYSDNEGKWPLGSYSGFEGFPTGSDSLSGAVAPIYINKLPTPKLKDRMGSFNGLSLDYDIEAQNSLSLTPPTDIYISEGAPHATPLINRPFVYAPSVGLVYICNGNYDVSGRRFFEW
jgi:prepilin-type N-terminal cleavage/methylation domain-containing protein